MSWSAARSSARSIPWNARRQARIWWARLTEKIRMPGVPDLFFFTFFEKKFLFQPLSCEGPGKKVTGGGGQSISFAVGHYHHDILSELYQALPAYAAGGYRLAAVSYYRYRLELP